MLSVTRSPIPVVPLTARSGCLSVAASALRGSGRVAVVVVVGAALALFAIQGALLPFERDALCGLGVKHRAVRLRRERLG